MKGNTSKQDTLGRLACASRASYTQGRATYPQHLAGYPQADAITRGCVRSGRWICSMIPERETSRGCTHDESETNRAGGSRGPRHQRGRGTNACQKRKPGVGEGFRWTGVRVVEL